MTKFVLKESHVVLFTEACTVKPVAIKHSIEAAPRDSRQAGGGGDIAFCFTQIARQQVLFDLVDMLLALAA